MFKFSFIIPVYRESRIINSAIDHIKNLRNSLDAEIIVVDGEPERSTIQEIASENVKKVPSPKGRGNQLNAGAGEATGAILIFFHADNRLPADALMLIELVMEDEGNAAGAFDLAIDSGYFAFRVIEKMASWRTRITRLPYGDQAVFMRRDYFRTLGGFRNIPIMEDVELMRCIKRKGGKIRILKEKVKTSSRRWDKEGIVFCTLRNWFLMTLYLLGVEPETLARFYRYDQKL